MKTGKRWIAFLLIALLLSAFMPAGSFADPPAGGTTHRHQWVVTSYKKATCTEQGKKTWKCSLCGQTYTETYKALGHKWDDGVITTEPGFFKAGIKTYTCQRDKNHTYTEEIDPTEWMFATLTGGVAFEPEPGSVRNTLIIIEQPVGGSIDRYEDETHTMHVKASGGTGNYSYEWHSGAQEIGKKEGYNELIKWFVGLFGITPEMVDEMLNQPLSTTDTFSAETGNDDYWCVVSDEAGNTAKSEKAHVYYKLRIVKQPENINLQSVPNPVLTCQAADGSGDYSYKWMNDKEEEKGTGPTLPTSEIDDYTCIVTDNVTGETMVSDVASIYSGEPLILVNITPDCEIWPGEYCPLSATFTGGTAPFYEVWWDRDGTAIDSNETLTEDGGSSLANAVTFGEYTLHVVDDMKQVLTATCTVSEKHLTILQQPVGGAIPKNGYGTMDVEVTGGEGAYTYVLYRNGSKYSVETYDSGAYSYPIYYSGEYYYQIKDSKGHSIESVSVYFEEGEALHIKNQTESESIIVPNGTTFLSVEAAGGKEPYTYEWQRKVWGNWYKTGETGSTYEASFPGEYACVVRDANNDPVRTKSIPVTYTGAAPWIILQPRSQPIKKSESWPTLYCSAIVAEGHGIRYEWYKKQTGGILNLNWDLKAYDTDTFTPPGIGMYRCKVVDTTTNGWMWSDIAVICEELSATNNALWPDHENDDTCRYSVTIKGGSHPYILKIYARYYYKTDDGWNRQKNVLYKTVTLGASGVYETYVPRWIEPGEEDQTLDGVYKLYRPWFGYQIEIFDSTGQRVETVPLVCP